jgi:mono/diheme cytochrome c family protein
MKLRRSILAWAFRAAGLSAISLILISGLWTSVPSAQSLQAPTPTPRFAPTATPPTQGGHGENLYYVNCLACHGDRGQGLTDEFRVAHYPPDDVDCWKSGCHGNRPYDGGFTLPKTIPALIGPDALERFNTAAKLYDYIRVAMPFDRPGSLPSTEYMQLTVFLLEENNLVPVGTHLDPDSAATVLLRGAPTPSEVTVEATTGGGASAALIVAASVVVMGTLGLALIRRRRAG